MTQTHEQTNAPRPAILRVIAVVFLGPFMTQLDATVVNVALPTIRADLHASLGSAQWVVSGYLLALALMLPLNGWLVDRLGAKRLYLLCFSSFTAASVLCGLAHSVGVLVSFRVVQGIAGGLLAPMTQLMIARVAGKQMARFIGYAAVPVLLAPILGPIIAGAILEYARWPWLFYVNLPIGILALAMAAILLPSDEDVVVQRPFDSLGFLLISPALVCLLYGLGDTTHLAGAATLVTGALLLAAFVVHARRSSAPLIDLDLFRNKIFATASVTQLLANGATYAGQFLIPLYLITGCGLTSSRAGLLLTPMGFGMLCSFPLMGYLTDRFGFRLVSAGGALVALVSTLPFLWMVETHFSSTITAASMFVLGASRGAIGVPSISAGYAAVPRDRLAVATTAANIVQRLGGPIATTIVAMALAFSPRVLPAAGPRSFLIAFVLLTALNLSTLLSASRLPTRVQPQPS